MPGFELSRRARGDLVEIGLYGADRWGDERSAPRCDALLSYSAQKSRYCDARGQRRWDPPPGNAGR